MDVAEVTIMHNRNNYEEAPEYAADAYAVAGYRRITPILKRFMYSRTEFGVFGSLPTYT